MYVIFGDQWIGQMKSFKFLFDCLLCSVCSSIWVQIITNNRKAPEMIWHIDEWILPVSKLSFQVKYDEDEEGSEVHERETYGRGGKGKSKSSFFRRWGDFRDGRVSIVVNRKGTISALCRNLEWKKLQREFRPFLQKDHNNSRKI